MSQRTSIVVAALGLTVSLAACDDAGRSVTGPALNPPASPPPAALVGGAVSGVVFEQTPGGRVPVAGVEVYCDACGPLGHTGTFTDAEGAYRIEGAPGGVTVLLLSKAGYRLPRPDFTLPPSPNGWMGGMNATINGDTKFDVEIVRDAGLQ